MLLFDSYKLFNVYSCYALRWIDSGNKIAFTSGSSTRIYNAGTPYDMKTIAGSGYTSKSLSGAGYGPQELTYNSSGTVLFFGPEIQYKAVRQYNLSTGFDASTINTTPAHILDLTSGSGLTGSIQCGTVSDDGQYIYAISSNTCYQWTLSTPFNLSTASFTRSQSGFSNAQGSFKINHDGTQVLTISSSGKIRSYTLSTGFDISTATYDNKEVDVNILHPGVPPISWNPCMTIAPPNKIQFFPYYGAYAIAITFT